MALNVHRNHKAYWGRVAIHTPGVAFSCTFVQTLPELVTPLKGHTLPELVTPLKGHTLPEMVMPLKGHTLPELVTLLKGHTLPELVMPLVGHPLSSRSCPPTLSAPTERSGY